MSVKHNVLIMFCHHSHLFMHYRTFPEREIVNNLKDDLVVANNLQYNNKKIEVVSEYNYLGIKLDNKLTLENHINKSVSKANKKLYMIYKLRKCLSKKITALLYKQLVRPHLEYCDFLVDSCLKKHCEKFNKVQKRALRIINYGRGAQNTYEDTMCSRRKEHLLMNMFAQKDDTEYVDVIRPDMQLRNHNGTKFKIKATRNQRVFKIPYYRGVQSWEQLPNAIQTLHVKKEFKKHIKDMVL